VPRHRFLRLLGENVGTSVQLCQDIRTLLAIGFRQFELGCVVEDGIGGLKEPWDLEIDLHLRHLKVLLQQWPQVGHQRERNLSGVCDGKMLRDGIEALGDVSCGDKYEGAVVLDEYNPGEEVALKDHAVLLEVDTLVQALSVKDLLRRALLSTSEPVVHALHKHGSVVRIVNHGVGAGGRGRASEQNCSTG